MKGKTGILILALVLVSLSYLLQWQSEGGSATRLPLDDRRVKFSLDYLATYPKDRTVAMDGELQRAWLNEDNRGYTVSLIVTLNGYPWHASVVFSPDGVPAESAVHLFGGLPLYVRRVGIALAVLWLVAGVLGPRIFGRKCPACSTNLWKPAYLEIEETSVYPGGFDDAGDSLPPIVRRDFVCNRCGYRRVTFAIPFSRAGRVWHVPFLVTRASPSQVRTVEKAYEAWWESNPKKTRFHTQDEWRAFYDELKASEHEEEHEKGR